MRFEVVFRPGWGYAVDLPDRVPGLEQLDGLPGVLPEQVEGLPAVRCNPVITLTVPQARACGHFEGPRMRALRVTVPSGSLNGYVRFEPVVREGGRVGWEAVLDEAALVADWGRLGYPLIWEPRAPVVAYLRAIACGVVRGLQK